MDQIIPSLMPFIIFGLMLAVYFAPCFIAFFTRHRHRYAITFLSIMLGWTVVFWVACMVWSLMSQPEDKKHA